MILITGCAGKTGRNVLQALVEREEPVRALVYQPEQIDLVESIGAQDVVVGDMNSAEAMREAVQGIRAIYHIPPNVSPHEISIGQTMIAAAKEAGVQHFVYHSVLKPQSEAMPHHWRKLRVEELLLESRMLYTIMQPAVYMQNLLVHWKKILQEGIYAVPYPTATRLSFVDLRDVAQAAAIVLTGEGHEFAQYELVGTEGISQSEVASILGKELGRPVQAVSIPIDTWRRQAKESGLGEEQIETLTKMFAFYQQYDFIGNPRVLGWLLEYPPTTLNKFIRQVHKEMDSPHQVPV